LLVQWAFLYFSLSKIKCIWVCIYIYMCICLIVIDSQIIWEILNKSCNSESSYILILIIHNIIFDIVVLLGNLYVEFYKCKLPWLTWKGIGLPMWQMRILWWDMTLCFWKVEIETLCIIFSMIQLFVSTLIMIWKVPMTRWDL